MNLSTESEDRMLVPHFSVVPMVTMQSNCWSIGTFCLLQRKGLCAAKGNRLMTPRHVVADRRGLKATDHMGNDVSQAEIM
jgi:hypothetical protein